MFDPIVPKLGTTQVTVRKLPTIAGRNSEELLDLAFRIRCTAFYLLTRNPLWLQIKRPTLRITED